MSSVSLFNNASVVDHSFSTVLTTASVTQPFPNSSHKSSLAIPPACPCKNFLACFSFKVRFCTALPTSSTLTSQWSCP